MADRAIQISVDTTTGDFTYTPTHVRAKPGDTITFSCPTGPFAVMFKHTAPGKHVHLHAVGGASSQTSADSRGVHQYAAAIFAAGRVYVDGGCGDIGVGD
jgi:plastocyanin